MKVYYNENDPKKAHILRQLMSDGFISEGFVDERSIEDVRGEELQGYERCHFFAGIGLWDYALSLANWPEGRPVWTGSCPCQPFSSAGKQKAKADDRHLWPQWERLIRECKPATVFGEQVAQAITYGWLDDVYQGLEAEGYAVGAMVLPASAVGAPHRRERLFFVGDTSASGQEGVGRRRTGEELAERRSHDAWAQGEWVHCPDGKQRLIEPRIPLLAHRYPGRVGILHAAGDAIVPQVAAVFIRALIT